MGQPISGQPPAQVLAGLAEALQAAVPSGALAVDADRGLADRLAGRPGTVKSITVTGAGQELSAKHERHRLTTVIARVVHGVVISRRPVGLAEWLEELAGVLRQLVAESAADDAAVRRALVTLGVAEPGSDLLVDPVDPGPDLRALPARLAGRLPDDVIDTVRGICDQLVVLLGRGDGDVPAAHTLRRTATDYLPGTLRAYLALPAEWARTHQLPEGGTSLDALRAQLRVLSGAVAAMAEAAGETDVQQLLANGNFLADKFGPGSTLRLPPGGGEPPAQRP